MSKPEDVFSRDREWAELERFVTAPDDGATLGLVYGRRRQGKTYLLEGLVESHGGLYLGALKQSREQNLERLARAYETVTDSAAPIHFRSWDEAFGALLRLGAGSTRPVPVVLDEFPYLLTGSPELPSLLQALLSPRGELSRGNATRLILCGSALSTMRSLLAGTAPLRGRASLELLLQPFGYRDAAAYWGVDDDLELAVRLHALVGGTPAYLAMSGGVGPKASSKLDAWVIDRLLNPASAMFREGDVLLAEEDAAVATQPYLAVLNAVSQGNTRRGAIAAAVGRPETALGHALAILTETGLVTARDDALRAKRTTFRVAEPILRFHRLVVAPNAGPLARHRSAAVWTAARDTVSSNVYGPHFEDLARSWCVEHASPDTLGGLAREAAPTEVTCREHRLNHEIDVVVLGSEPVTGTGVGRPVLALGEAKWRTASTAIDQLRRLEHVRDLLRLGPGTKLLLFSRSGFTEGVRTECASRADVVLVDLDRLYRGD